MAQVILCLDDQPARYKQFKEIIVQHNLDLVAITLCRSQEFLQYLDDPLTVAAIYIKFEMPFGTGSMFAGMLKNRSIPIIITEPGKYEISKIKNALTEIKYDPSLIFLSSFQNSDWELQSLEFLELLPKQAERNLQNFLLKKISEI